MISFELTDDELIEGNRCLELGIPWQTPESIYKEDLNLNQDDIVLEIGMGGSTIFFTDRCKKIISFESNMDWLNNVRNKVDHTYRDGDVFHIYVTVDYILGAIDYMKDDVTVVSIDPQGDVNRSAILSHILSKSYPNLKMIVLDNYAHPKLFPDHYDKILDLGEGWECFTYDHDRWAGRGTRLYIKNAI